MEGVGREKVRVVKGVGREKVVPLFLNCDRKVNVVDFRGWIQFLYKPKPGESHPNHSFYKRLFPSIVHDIQVDLGINEKIIVPYRT